MGCKLHIFAEFQWFRYADRLQIYNYSLKNSIWGGNSHGPYLKITSGTPLPNTRVSTPPPSHVPLPLPLYNPTTNSTSLLVTWDVSQMCLSLLANATPTTPIATLATYLLFYLRCISNMLVIPGYLASATPPPHTTSTIFHISSISMIIVANALVIPLCRKLKVNTSTSEPFLRPLPE